MALEPQSGRIAWKYDVGPKPERLDPPITIKDAWGEHVFQFGPATSTVWSTPSYHAASRTIFFGTDTNNATLMALDASTGEPLREIQLPAVWSGPAVSRGRIYVGTGNIVLSDDIFIGPTQTTGSLFSFGLPGEDEVSRMGGGKE